MATELSALGIVIRSDGVVVAGDRLDGFSKAADDAGRASDRLEKKSKSLDGALASLASKARNLTGLLAAAFGVRQLASYADKWSDLTSQVGTATKNMSGAAGLMKEMARLARASYSPLEQTVQAFANNSTELRELGYSTQQQLDYTEALNHALVTTATRGERAASVQMALSRAMAIGKLNGDGLETVLANGGRIAEALAKKLNVNVSALRGMASQGKITGKVIASALIDELINLRKEAGEMPATIADGITLLGNASTVIVGVLDKITGSSGTIATIFVAAADAIQNFAFLLYENSDKVVQAFDVMLGMAITVATYFAAKYAVAIGVTAVKAMASFVTQSIAFEMALGAQSTAAALGSVAIKGFVVAMNLLRSAIIATGIGAFVVASGYLVAKFIELTRAAGSFSEAIKLTGDMASEVWGRMKTAGASMQYYLGGIAEYIRSVFLEAFAFIAKGWDDTINGMVSGFNENIAGSWIGEKLGAKIIDFKSDSASGISGLAAGAKSKSKSNFAMSDYLSSQSGKPLESWEKIQGVIDKSNESATSFNATITDTATKINDAGDAAGKAGEKGESASKKLSDVLNDLDEEYKKAKATWNLSDLETEIWNKQNEAGVKAESLQGKRIAQRVTEINQLNDLKSATNEWSQTITSSLSSFLTGGMKFKDMVGSIISKLGEMAMNSAFQSLFSSVGSGGILGSIVSAFTGVKAAAKGDVFSGRGISAYSGKIVSSPTVFPFANGIGLMGEAGPEAVMPLTRGADGSLGVSAVGGAGGGSGERQQIEVLCSFDEEGTAIVKKVSQKTTSQAINRYDKNLNNRVNSINKTPWKTT